MTRRTRLLVVSPSLSGGGAERFVSTLVSRLDRERFESHICLLRDRVTYPVPDHVERTVLGKTRPWHTLRAIRRLRRTIEKWRPDAVLGTITFTNWLLGTAIRNYPRPLLRVARFGCAPRSEYGPIVRQLTRRGMRSGLLRHDVWVSNSEQQAGLLVDYYGVAKARVRTIYTPVDFDRLGQVGSRPSEGSPSAAQQNSCPRIVAAGRLARQKRFDLLLQAFARVRQQTRACLTICGDGPLRSALAEQIRRLQLSEDVRLLPYQPEGYQWLRNADLFALASDFEGMPNALIEAQAMGLPAVATECETGPGEIVEDGKTGFLVPVGDARTLADRLLELLQNPALRAAMGGSAAARMRMIFREENTIAKWEQLLDTVNKDRAVCAA